jgi:ribulose-bisphosphate carboxylase large chain
METFQVTYLVESTPAEVEERAKGIAVEQSVEVPLQAIRRADILENVVGKVAEIEEAGSGQYRVTLDFNVDNTGLEPAQFANVLFGNTSLQPSVQLVDMTLTDSLLAAFGGPRFGMAGLREMTGAATRPLTATALKPMGLSPEELADLCRAFARAGLDIIKDDHGLADQRYAPFAERVRACQAAVDEVYAETGHRALYAPNMAGTPRSLYRMAEVVDEAGVGCVMIAPMLVGIPVFHEMVRDVLKVPVLAHPAFAGSLRMTPDFLLGKLYRLLGADASIFPNYGGRFSYSKATCTQLADNLREPWGELRGAFPAPAGGMQVDRVDEMIDFYGRDVMLLIGGSLLVADDITAHSRTFVENVHAAEED